MKIINSINFFKVPQERFSLNKNEFTFDKAIIENFIAESKNARKFWAIAEDISLNEPDHEFCCPEHGCFYGGDRPRNGHIPCHVVSGRRERTLPCDGLRVCQGERHS